MSRRDLQRPIVAAAVVSLLFHLSLLIPAVDFWPAPARDIPFPIEARLQAPAPPSPRISEAPSPRPAVRRKSPVAAAAPVAAAVDVDADAEVATLPPPMDALAAAETPAHADDTVVAPGPRRDLPSELTLRYAVLAGEEGFRLGHADYQWKSAEGRYTLVSVAEASGLASLFMSGRMTQVSRGIVDGQGLRPEQYWVQKGARRQDAAHFDWAAGRLVMPTRQRGEALPALAQDLLSFPFHLAMTVRRDTAGVQLPITNGKKLRVYTFRPLGEETLRIGDVDVSVLHLQGAVEGEDGRLEVWLAIDRGGLPVKMRTLDDKGRAMTLIADQPPPLDDAEQAAGSFG